MFFTGMGVIKTVFESETAGLRIHLGNNFHLLLGYGTSVATDLTCHL